VLSRRLLGPIINLPDRAGSIRSIALLRGVAVLLVLWDHIVGGWTKGNGRSWIGLDVVRDWVSGPFAIIQDFGFLGVTIFFLLSGYIISEVAVRESRRVFAVRRLLRIYPALIVSIAFIVALDRLRPSFGLTSQGFGVAQTAWSMSLLNYVRVADSPVNGVAWSLIIEVLFYGLIFLCLGLLKRRPLVAIAVELSIVLLVVSTAKNFPITGLVPNWFQLSASVSYLPLLIIGQSIWMWSSRRASALQACVCTFCAWLIFVLGMRRIRAEFLAPSNSYGVSVFIAIAIFIVALTNESRIKLPKGIAALSVVSYSVYLIHGPLTSLVMDRLAPSLPFTVHATIALLILAVFAVLMWRFVEVPTQLLARRLTAKRGAPS